MIYITGDETTRGLTPHNIKKSIGVYQVRENIYILSQPITKLAELSQAKIQETEKKKEYLNGTHAEISKININELRSRTVLLNKPILVCKSYSCIKTEKLSNNQEESFIQQFATILAKQLGQEVGPIGAILCHLGSAKIADALMTDMRVSLRKWKYIMKKTLR